MAAFRPFSWIFDGTRAIEALAGFAAWWLAIRFAWDPSLFGANQAYRIMEAIIPGNDWISSERAWALFAASAGLCQTLGVCANVHSLRLPGALLSFVFFLSLATAFHLGAPYGLSGGVYVVIAAMMFWVVLRGPQDG